MMNSIGTSGAIFMLCNTQRAGHMTLVDLGSNDVKHTYKSESVKVDKLMQTGCYSHVIHMNGSSTLRGVVHSVLFYLLTQFGAPKIRAVELIRDLEKEKRGIYVG